LLGLYDRACRRRMGGGPATAVYCVDPAGGAGVTHTNLQTALTAASSDGLNNLIKVVRETYSGNFLYSSTQGYSIQLQGGYAAGCASDPVVNPANTILDGGGSGRVLRLYDSLGGNIYVNGFTIQNGNTTGDGAGINAESSATGTAGTVTITNNIIQGNTTTAGGGGVYARSYSNSGTAGTFTLVNNIIKGNSADVGGGVFASSYTVSGTPGQGTITNNTITGNTATDYGGGAFLYAYGGVGGILNVYNNIIWGNTAPTGADINATNTSDNINNGYNNDYSTMAGSWDNSGGNIDANPLFVDASVSNYHLSATSPCFGAGDGSAPSVPSTDFEGDSRTHSVGTLDMGADEYTCGNYPFKISASTHNYTSIQNAYDSMSTGATLLIHSLENTENLAFNINKTVTLKGGYGCGFSSNPGYTRVKGSLTISSGTVTVENIKIK
jgi:hypothetical protein